MRNLGLNWACPWAILWWWHCEAYVKPLCYIPKTKITLYVNYTLLFFFKFKSKKDNPELHWKTRREKMLGQAPSWVYVPMFLDVLGSPCPPSSMQMSPQILNSKHWRQARLWQMQELQRSLCRLYPGLEKAFICIWDLTHVYPCMLAFPGHEPGALHLEHGGRRRKPPLF